MISGIIDSGQKIVTDNLYGYIDAAQLRCYSGSGNIINELLNNAVANPGLINGASFSNIYGGTWAFDGVNDYATWTRTGLWPNNNFTMDIWFRPTTTHQIDTESTSGTSGLSGQRYLIAPGNFGSNSGAGISAGTNGVSVYEHGSGYIPALLVYSGTISSTLFTHAVVTYTNKQPRLYINGTLVRTGLTSLKTTVYVGVALAIGDYGYFPGNISIYRVYTKPLTATEVLQNYNAEKSRFGL